MDDPDIYNRPLGLERKARPWPGRPVDPTSGEPTPTIPPLPAEFRARGRQPGDPPPPRPFLPALGRWIRPTLLFAAGAGCGALLANQWPARQAAPADAPNLASASPGKSPDLKPSTPTTLLEKVDRAYATSHAGDYPAARKQFADLLAQRPDWLGLNLSVVRAAIYQLDGRGANLAIRKAEQQGGITAGDSYFFQALIGLMTNDYASAERYFPLAVAANPCNADYYYFWGECLMRDGKPAQAAERFRSALIRNEYETADSLYQAKLWLAEIQTSSESSLGDGAKIDAGLEEPNPPGAALIAGAARDIRRGLYADAAAKMRRAGMRYESNLFRVLLQDVAFRTESWRPEFEEFYPKAQPGKPASS